MVKNLLILFTVFSGIVCAQSPGGINENLQLWIKADLGPDCVLEGCNPTTWIDQSLNGHDADAVGPNPPIYFQSDINYNPTIEIDLNGGTGWATTLRNVGDFILVSKIDSASEHNWSYILGNDFSERGIRIDVLAKEWAWYILNTFVGGITPSYSINGSVEARPATTNLNNPNIITSNDVNAIGVDSLDDGLAIGTDPQTNQRIWKIAELIAFDSTNTSDDIVKIESYLAIKYGITLNNTIGGSAGDYIASSDSLIWDASINDAYHHHIIGIGRDDDSELYQKQSKTVYDSTRIYIDSLRGSNILNEGSFMDDQSFVIMGDNENKMCATIISNVEKPEGIFSRIAREWKITNSNFTQNFNIDLVLDSCGNFDLIDNSDLRLLVGSNDDFNDATIYSAIDGLAFSHSDATVTIRNIGNAHIPVDSKRYITLASIDAGTPLPIELVNFEITKTEDGTVALNWQTASEINNDFFTIERSRNGIDWYNITTIDGAGNSSAKINYTAFDYSPLTAISYYRLKQTDFDGLFTYSNQKSINIENLNSLILKVYPNPTHEILNLITNRSEELDQVMIFDLLGKDVTAITQLNFVSDTGLKIDLSNLNTGTYFVKTNSIVTRVHKRATP